MSSVKSVSISLTPRQLWELSWAVAYAVRNAPPTRGAKARNKRLVAISEKKLLRAILAVTPSTKRKRGGR